MKEEEPNWFAKWEDELPSQEELMPLSQTLITQELALAFDIPGPNSNSNHHLGHHTSPPQSQQHQTPSSQQQQQLVEYDSPEMGGGGSGGGVAGDEQARTLKRPRLVWTPQLHKRFVDAVAHLGIKNAVPKTIMQLMSVDGLTRENVASHLQKYRLYLKRMQTLSSGAGGVGGPISHSDPATEQLFASGPVPHHFLNRGPPAGPGGGGGAIGGGVKAEQFMPYVPVTALQHQQMAAAAAAAAAHQQQQYYHHRHMGHLGSPPGGGFDHGFLARQQQGMHRMMGAGGVGMAHPPPSTSPFREELESGGGERKVLTLFPTHDD